MSNTKGDVQMPDELRQISESLRSLKEKGKFLRVLYVEDDPLISSEYHTFLKRFFNHIELRDNGSDGLIEALKNDYDLIVSDIQMPKLNGLDMIEKIKEQKPNQLSIIISAHDETKYLHRAITLGVDGYIFKPLQRDETIKVLMKIVNIVNSKYLNAKYQEELELLIEEKTTEVVQMFVLDKLTGLYGLVKLQQDIASNRYRSIALVKIRNFKNLNDFFGYEIGDSVLIQVAEKFKEFFGDKKYNNSVRLYRASGTHFTILADLPSRELFELVSELVKAYENSRFLVGNEPIMFEMDGGVVDDQITLSLSNADKALRQSRIMKSIFYLEDSFSLNEQHKIRLKWIESIRNAINENRIIPYYQPIVDNATKSIRKYEALVRIISPDGEVILPGSFLSISKETKMYNEIVRQVITRALRDFENSQCSVSINLSMDDIQNDITREFLREQITLFSEPQRLVFEILETEQIISYADLEEFINEMHCFGAKIAIDDFGSGYSNFEHLVKLNVDYIKFDGSLISNIDSNAASYNIVEMLTNFSLKMKIKTIAEFVSNQEIQIIVNSLGVNESQGYHFSQPIPFNKSMNLVRQLAIIQN